jgi:DNA-binding CsgD family transcriptional regulator
MSNYSKPPLIPKKMDVLKPITVQEFTSVAKKEQALAFTNYEQYFESKIIEAANYAIGSYFWIMGDNANMKITAASQNIRELTPYEQAIWADSTPLFLAENIHIDDRFYVLSALQLAIAKIEELPEERQGMVRVNIYARMLNAQSEYRWVLMQIPGLYIDKESLTNCGLIMITDLSHLDFTTKPIMMTLTDKVNNVNQYFQIAPDEMKLVSTQLPNITKREKEILQLMAKGLNSPEIAERLFLSYHTVEKHKRNLREKTASKTSAELMSFVIMKNLI